MGWDLTRVGVALGRRRGWVREQLKRFNDESLAGLEDRRAENPGRTPSLNNGDVAELKKALADKAPDGGLWTGPKVRASITARKNKQAGKRSGFRYLKRLGYSLQQPQTQHGSANLEAQEAFNKIGPFVDDIPKKAALEATVEVWAQDEARIGLKPTTRRIIWAEKNHRPVVKQHLGYEWLYLYGFVRLTTGDVEWLLLPAVNIPTFNLALEHFARAVGASETNRIVLVLDGAGWHTSKDVVWPKELHPLVLPAYSPELQPAEKLGPLVREATANRFIKTLDEVEQILVDRCRHLITEPETIAAHTRFGWWPADGNQ